MLKKIVCLVIISSVLILVNNVEKDVINGEEKLLTTFNEVDFKLLEADLNIWGEYSRSYITELEMRDVGLMVADNIGLEQKFEEDYIFEETKRIYTINKTTKEVDTTIKVVELIEESDDGLKVINYIVVNLILNDKCNSIIYYRDKINNIFEDMEIESRNNLTITSIHKGKINEEQAEQLIDEVVGKMNCKVKDCYKTDNIYSIYGYSKYIEEYIVSEGEKINIDLALTYNELEDTTYLYAAIPIITIDY